MISTIREQFETVERCHGGDGSVLNYSTFKKQRDGREVDFIDLVVVPPKSSIGRHRHGDNEEWYVILDGQAEMWVNGRDTTVGSGDIVMNPPFGEHGLVNTSTGNVFLLVVQFSTCAAEKQAAGKN